MRAALRADLGGSLAGLWMDTTPVLRSVEPDTLEGPRASACFPLVPWSNRIGFGRFTWQGRTHELAMRGLPGQQHAIHGTAWQQAWQVVDADATHATLRCTHAGDAYWPFSFEATQRFALHDAGLRVELDLRNTDAAVQPAGLGWHPYFPKRASSRIHIECEARWERDATTLLPTRRVAQRGIDAEVRHLDFDHGIEGWPGHARVRDELLAVTIASSLPHLVVFTPPQQAHFCIEPASHAINALGSDDPIALGMRALAPGETMQAWMTIDAARR